MNKKIVNTAKAPTPIGPYSQAVKAAGMLYLSGQIAINPQTSQLVEGSIEEETIQVMSNLHAVLDAEGLDFNHVVKSTIFLSDMKLFAQVNEVYNKYFEGDFPARETVAVKGLPRNVNVEISMIAAE
ncbi:MAG: RidA family protein [Ginsengibacter sp.]